MFILELSALARIYHMVGAPRGYYLGDMILEDYLFLGGNNEILYYWYCLISLFPYFLISLSPCFSIFVFVVKTNGVIVFSIQLNTYYSSGFLVPHPLPP